MDLVEDRDTLVAALRARGVDYLAPGDAAGPPVDDAALVASLAAHADPRLKQALSALFLVRPDLAALVPGRAAALPPAAAVELTARYMAAIYLRAMWATRLRHYLPELPPLPDYYSHSLALPAPGEMHGKAGLYALAAWHERQTGRRINYRAEYENAAELLFGRLRLRVDRHVAALAARPG
jgi:hypothetical protein